MAKPASVRTNPPQPPDLRPRSRGYLWALLGMATFVYLPFVAWSAYEQAPVGDLVRIGAWSERLYGWREPQPAVQVRHNRADAVGAQAWVLGDSFSMGNVWQSQWAAQSGLKVYTRGYQGHGCIQAFIEESLRPDQAGVVEVVVQTVERHLLDRLAQQQPCPPAGPAVVEGPPGTTSVRRADWVVQPGVVSGQGFLQIWPLVDWRHLVRSQLNERRVAAAGSVQAPAVVAGDTLNAGLLPSAPKRLFSHLQSSRLLYYLGDDFKRQWQPAQLQQAAARAAAWQAKVQAAGKRFTLLVVPDKSTVYRPWMHASSQIPEAPILQAFESAGVNIVYPLQAMRSAAAKAPDFYWPDDTHLSPKGFAWLGRHLHEVQARPLAALQPVAASAATASRSASAQ